ncbi:MAG: proline--tRNA ligase [Proteobacteria bacterium]|nr:proline--tRNA ligase [Pseudomonadota bacterium]
MRFSKMLLQTYKEDPAEAEAISHKLMIRAGMVRQLAAGLYIYLPLGLRVLEKVNAIIREEMNAIGGQEISMPVLHPAEIWQQSGRWYDIGDEMFRLQDRTKRDMVLGMTHEEVVAWLAAREIRSYRDLPQIWYQIQTKLRDEARPKGGILRTREFLMKDSYSLDLDSAGLNHSYQLHYNAYCKIFQRCGIKYYAVESDPGMMGGAGAHEFMALSQAGEDEVALCDNCGYAANVDLANSQSSIISSPVWDLEEVSTPDSRTIEEVCGYLGIDPRLTIKSLLLMGKDGPILALLRGDQKLHEKKFRRLVGEFRPAHREEVKEFAGVEAGFLGPVSLAPGRNLPMIADVTLQQGVFVAGANREGYHLRGVTPGKHFTAKFVDIHVAMPGDTCPACPSSLRVEKAIEIGNIFKLGTKYSLALKALYLDRQGQEKPIVMGSYGIGPARIIAAAIEQSCDQDGIIFPLPLTPFDVHLLPVNLKQENVRQEAEKVYERLSENVIPTLFDDRQEAPGVKFKDADLIGIPLRLTLSAKTLKNNMVEVKVRRTGEVYMVKLEQALSWVQNWIASQTKK